jgi:hypothetical protein
MKSLTRITLLVVLGTAVATTQSLTSKPNSATASRSRPHGNVLDWGLKQINPHDVDYGKHIEELRQAAIDNTIHDYGFWSDCVAAGVLGMMFLIVLWQDRKNRRMTFSTARIVTAYHNQLAMAQDQITLLSAEYAQAKRILDEQTEGSYVSRPQTAKRESTPGSSSDKGTTAAAPDGQSSHEQLLAENGSLKQQVKILTAKWQEEQQKNLKLKGE